MGVSQHPPLDALTRSLGHVGQRNFSGAFVVSSVLNMSEERTLLDATVLPGEVDERSIQCVCHAGLRRPRGRCRLGCNRTLRFWPCLSSSAVDCGTTTLGEMPRTAPNDGQSRQERLLRCEMAMSTVEWNDRTNDDMRGRLFGDCMKSCQQSRAMENLSASVACDGRRWSHPDPPAIMAWHIVT